MPSCKSGGTVKSRVVNQRGGNMVLDSGTTTQIRGTKRKRSSIAKQSKFQHLPFLCACFKSNGKQRKDMIAHANRGQMEAIGEVALNLLKGNIIVPSSSFKRLKPHKSKLLYLTRKKPSLKQKKEVLNQKGGFLPGLAALIAPLAVDYWVKCSNEARSKDGDYTGTFITKRGDKTAFDSSCSTSNADEIRSRHEANHRESPLPEDQKVLMLDQLLQRYQGLTKQMKTESAIKLTVVLPKPDPLPATETSGKTDESTPAEVSRKRDLNTSQSKSSKMPRKLPATPMTTVESKIPRQIETMPSISPEEKALPLLLDTPPDSTSKSSNKRKARTPMVARLWNRKRWEHY